MRILVTLSLLLFELFTIKAHVVPSLKEPQNSTSDVYEIQELGQPKTTFTVPKPEKPTLREIVYYHLIERPYGGDNELERHSESELPQIEMDDSMRHFTNGHGYQFADTELHETENHDVPVQPDYEDLNEEEEKATFFEEENDDATLEYDDEEDSNEEEEQHTTLTAESTEQPKVTSPSEEKKIKHRQFLFDRQRERYEASFKKANTTEKAADETTTTKVETTTAPTSTPAARSKRSVNYEEIPIAPTLPPLDYNNYPSLRAYSGIQPMYQTTKYPVIQPANEDDLKKAMKFKINDIFATMKPYNDDDDRQNNDNDIRVATHRPERVKTYGMNLSEDQGIVWNNLWRPINYHVGEPVKLYEINEYQVSTITPYEEETTSQPPTTTTTTTPRPDIEDIYVDIKKPHKNHKPTTKTERLEVNIDPRREEQNLTENEEEERDGDNIDSKSLIKHKKKPSNVTQEGSTNDAKPDLYEQLMNSDKFWKWLAHWTSNYMEVLSDRVKDMVKEEIAKGIKEYENEHLNEKKDEVKPINITPTKDKEDANKTDIVPSKETVIKNNTIVIDGKEIPITNTTNLNKGNATFAKDLLKKHRDRDEKKPIINKLNDTKSDNNKTMSEIKPNATKHDENHNNMKAQNIYGSSTGNEKVTNIFIFYPGTESEKIIADLKPYLDNLTKNSGITTIIKDKNEEDKKSKVTEKPVDTTSADKDSEMTTHKPIENDNLNKTDENKPVDNKDETIPEENKDQISNSTKITNSEKDSKKPNAGDKESITEKQKETTKNTEQEDNTSPNEPPKVTVMPVSNSTEVTTKESVSSTTVAALNSTAIVSDASTTIASQDTTTTEASLTSSTAP